METLLILASATVAVLALAFVWAMTARDRRPPLRTRQEEEMVGDDEERLFAAMTPASASPIDRNAPILEITAIEAALRDSRFIDGHMIEGPVIEGTATDGLADDAKARAWTRADAEEARESPAAPREHRSR